MLQSFLIQVVSLGRAKIHQIQYNLNRISFETLQLIFSELFRFLLNSFVGFFFNNCSLEYCRVFGLKALLHLIFLVNIKQNIFSNIPTIIQRVCLFVNQFCEIYWVSDKFLTMWQVFGLTNDSKNVAEPTLSHLPEEK